MVELRDPDLLNLHPATDEETGRRHLSHSSINTQLACLRRYGWIYEDRLELISQPKPLSMGRAFHEAIQAGDSSIAFNELTPVPSVWTEGDREQQVVMAVTAEAAAALYLRRWGRATDREVPYRVRLRNPETGRLSHTYDLVGAADGVIDHGDHLELIEDKFVGRVDNVTVRKVRLDRQVSLECYALWRITGKPVQVVNYRWVKKPSIRQRQNETVEAFFDRIIEDYRERPDFYAHEESTFRSPDDLLLIEQELWAWCEQLRHASRQKIWTRNTSSCGDYGGCPYLPLCAGDPDARSLYKERTTPVHGEDPDYPNGMLALDQRDPERGLREVLAPRP